MFSNKDNVSVLTAFMAHGIRHAVVCPGSRNAPIVHNLHALQQQQRRCGEAPLRLFSVTDERCAAFVALGLWQAHRQPVVVCVTSGSALLNLLPGVAEAAFQQAQLIIVSADRPPEMIGQLDGQTLPQPGALMPYARSWQLPEGHTLCGTVDERRQHIADLCRQAFEQVHSGPVHINVPITEPLFQFSLAELPGPFSRVVLPQPLPRPVPPHVLHVIASARRPAIIVGHAAPGDMAPVRTLAEMGWTVFSENISNTGIVNDTMPPGGIDLLVHVGGCLVEKRLKLQLRQTRPLTVIRIDPTDLVPATFGHVDHKVTAPPRAALDHIVEALSCRPTPPHTVLPPACLCQRRLPHTDALFLANSTAVRWANRHLRTLHPTFCNRGTNGIEGSLSAAAGYSLAQPHENVLCIIGDLSFFYDSNALWNEHLGGNLRVLLVNNHRGDIFYRLPGLEATDALGPYVAASHSATAQGIAASYRCAYAQATTTDLATDVDSLVCRLDALATDRPAILEVTIVG